MGDNSKQVFKVILTLGLFFALISFLPGFTMPGQWNDLQNQLAGQGFPTFINPYERRPAEGTNVLFPDVEKAQNTATEEGGCSDVADCTRDKDDGRYARLNNTDSTGLLSLDLSVGTDFETISSVRVYIKCRVLVPWMDTDNEALANPDNFHSLFAARFADLSAEPLAERTKGECGQVGGGSEPTGDFGFLEILYTDLGAVRMKGSIDEGQPWLGTEFSIPANPPDLNISITSFYQDCADFPSCSVPLSSVIDIDWIEVRIDGIGYGASTACGTFDVGCSILNFLDPVIKFVQAIINAVAFGVQVIFFAIVLIFNFIAGLIALVIWLYAIPDTPAEVQIIISVLTTALLGWLVYLAVKMVPFEGGE